MNWEALGSIGEIVGAIAVMVSLLFLAIQIRLGAQATQENSALLRSAMVRNSDEYITRWVETLLQNPELEDINSCLWIRSGSPRSSSIDSRVGRTSVFNVILCDMFILANLSKKRSLRRGSAGSIA